MYYMYSLHSYCSGNVSDVLTPFFLQDTTSMTYYEVQNNFSCDSCEITVSFQSQNGTSVPGAGVDTTITSLFPCGEFPRCACTCTYWRVCTKSLTHMQLSMADPAFWRWGRARVHLVDHVCAACTWQNHVRPYILQYCTKYTACACACTALHAHCTN